MVPGNWWRCAKRLPRGLEFSAVAGWDLNLRSGRSLRDPWPSSETRRMWWSVFRLPEVVSGDRNIHPVLMRTGSDTDPLLLDVEVAKMVRIRRSLTHCRYLRVSILITDGPNCSGWFGVGTLSDMSYGFMTSNKFKIATVTLGFISVLWLSHVGFHWNYSTPLIDCKHLKSSIQYTHWHPPDIP